MSSKRINIKDVINEEFYQLPKVFFWDQKYREGLSHGAKLLYMLVRDRFRLSLHTTKEAVEKGSESPAYVDKVGNIYCILDNQEIEFTLNSTSKTIIKFMDELIKLELVSTESVEGGANRIYLNSLDSSGATLAHFLGEKEYFKHVKSRKKKGKQPIKTLEECIAAAVDKYGPKQEGRNNSTPGSGENTSPSDGEIPPPGDEDIPPLGEENIHPNKNYSSKLDSSELDSNEIDTSVNNSSSSNEVNSHRLEEDKKRISVSDNYGLLDSILKDFDICKDLRGLNVVKKALMESKIESFYIVDVLNAIGSHSLNKAAYANKGEALKYEPAFFANNLVDRINENRTKRKNQEEREEKLKREAAYQAHVQEQYGKVKFYNWLEE